MVEQEGDPVLHSFDRKDRLIRPPIKILIIQSLKLYVTTLI